MPASAFKFSSPGVQIKEINDSKLPADATSIGPMVIGRFRKGPGMQPVTVNSTQELEEIFGSPINGSENIDSWRDGFLGGPSYASYAAYAHLHAQNGSPVTVMRLLGDKHPDATATTGEAGWDAGAASTTIPGGAYGLFVFPSSSTGYTDVTASLAAVWYFPTARSGSIELVGDELDAGSEIIGTSTVLLAEDGQFTARLNGTDRVVFSFTERSRTYIRNAFNTDPTLTNTSITTAANLKKYWLGETYERAVSDMGTGDLYGIILALSNGSTAEKADYLMDSQEARTGWFFTQDFGDHASYDPDNLQKLFRFKSRNGGEYDQKNFKITIDDLKYSNIENGFGSFTVKIRRIDDTDVNQKVVEQFTGCNLNPNSDNYLAKKIGDRYYSYDENKQIIRQRGTYVNKSKYVYVEMDTTVDNGAINATALPFGVYGPVKVNSFKVETGSIATGGFADRGYLAHGSDAVDTADVVFTGSFEFPSVPLVTTNKSGNSIKRLFYFGVDTQRSGASAFETSLTDLLYPLPAPLYNDGEPTTGTDYMWKFSLDNVKTASAGEIQYNSTSRVNGTSITAVDANGWKDLIYTRGIDGFTTVLYGGFDGFKITEKEPFGDHVLDGMGETSNYAFNTIKRAINIVADPDFVEYNTLVIPGLRNSTLTDYMLSIAEERGTCLAIMDLEDDYAPITEGTGSVYSDSDTVVDALQARYLDNTFGCSYYPWVQIKDPATDTSVFVPPSVVTLGVFASNDKTTQSTWFAPAGFNRGGLDQATCGLNVVTTADPEVRQADRDLLYEHNINPIAWFPGEGFVVYGQKTLAAERSALDRINVRRLLNYLKREISRIATGVLFDPNVSITWERFKGPVETLLTDVKTRFGLSDFKVLLNSTTTTPDLVDRNIMYAKILLKPVYAIEYIAVDMVISNTGAVWA